VSDPNTRAERLARRGPVGSREWGIQMELRALSAAERQGERRKARRIAKDLSEILRLADGDARIKLSVRIAMYSAGLTMFGGSR
jgi:hypothetical protein